MAMFVMREMVKKQGLERSFRIDSAATSREEIGNPCYPPARRKLAKEGLSGEGHAARKMVREDYENYDYLIGMDEENLDDMHRICRGDPEKKISLLLDWAGISRDVADPWYTGNFEATYQDLIIGCTAFLNKLFPKGRKV